jgi:hypothetical protein
MGPTNRRRASLVTALQKIATSIAGDLTSNTVPQRHRSPPAKRSGGSNPSTPAAIDENDIEMDDSPGRYPPCKPSHQFLRSQRTLCFDQLGASCSITAVTATITDTEDDDVPSSKQSQSRHRRHRETKVAFKVRNKYIRKSALQPIIGRSSLRSATASYGKIPNHLPRTLVTEKAAAADSSPAKTQRRRQKRIEIMNRNEFSRTRAIRSMPLSMSNDRKSLFTVQKSRAKVPQPMVAPLAILDRPKRERIPTDFFEPSFTHKINFFGNVSNSLCPSEAMKPVSSVASTVPNEDTVQGCVTESSPRIASLPCCDFPTKTASPSKTGFALEKRNRVPTDFYRPNAPSKKAIYPLISDTSHPLYLRKSLDKKKEHARLTITSKETNKSLSRNPCTFSSAHIAKERGKCSETVVRVTLGMFQSKVSAAVSSRPQTQYIRLRLSEHRKSVALQNCATPALRASRKYSMTPGAARQERTSINPLNRLQDPVKVVKCGGISSRSRVSNVLKGDSSCPPPHPTSLVKNLEGNVSGNQELLEDKSSISTLSYDTLLSQYNDKVSQGRCQPVHFGRTLHSAYAAVDRMLREMLKQVPEDIVDLDILADTREYKRSLRFFSIYEDREKLALVHEAQEDMETRGRMEVHSKANQLLADKERSELHVLGNRPVFFRSSCFLSRRCNIQCRSGPNCCVCGSGRLLESTVAPTASDYTPIPMIEPVDIDNESDTDVSFALPTKKRRRTSIQRNNVVRATIDALTELKYSLQFVEQYNDRSTFEGIEKV